MSGYFDYNATAPVHPAAVRAWTEAAEESWANASGLYRAAAGVRRRLEDARAAVAQRLGAEPERVVFTSGATEANNAVFEHAARAAGRGGGGKAVISAVEHPCVREAARKWFGPAGVLEVGMDGSGAFDLGALDDVLGGGGVTLVSVMAANNETGAVLPWEAVRDRCAAAGVPYHCDAAQWVGKRDPSGLGRCGFVTASGHKLGAAKGVGFLLVQEGSTFRSLVGGPQERGRRAGTEDYPGVASLLAAWDATAERDDAGRDAFEQAVARRVQGLRVMAAGTERLWNTSMLVVPAHPNLKWLTRLDAHGFQLSTGSACSAGKGNPSHVMAALGLGFDEMGRVLRASGGWHTQTEEWLALANAFGNVWDDLEAGGRTRQKKLDLRQL